MLEKNVNRHDASSIQFGGTTPTNHEDGVQSEGDDAPGRRPPLHGTVENNESRVTGPINLQAQSTSTKGNRGGLMPAIEELSGRPLGPPPDPAVAYSTATEETKGRE